ncbi:hypothetical protein HNP89_000603 [Methanococcus maripaludis]|uniref:Uncharacterized protein n=1 Tax=Methanococcus maripaludis TaxID=39152 RepID=A0A7J9P3M5_METMI|nr:hypothetical protein [Methanococcus maripaludis]MBA2852666.1 hypothetical protein [Methanococcus maripaludis]
MSDGLIRLSPSSSETNEVYPQSYIKPDVTFTSEFLFGVIAGNLEIPYKILDLVEKVEFSFVELFTEKYKIECRTERSWNEEWKIALIELYSTKEWDIEDKFEFLDNSFLEIGEKLNNNLEYISLDVKEE